MKNLEIPLIPIPSPINIKDQSNDNQTPDTIPLIIESDS